MAHLQEISETLGSVKVDKLVQAVAQRLQLTLGGAGTLGRLNKPVAASELHDALLRCFG